MNFARRGEVGRTEALLPKVAESIEKASGFHGWLWKLRLAEARAEIALAQEDWEAALLCADDAIEQCRARNRVKYEALALGTRGAALQALGRTKEAAAALTQALELEREIGDRALFLRTSATPLAIDGSDSLAREARAALEWIQGALPDEGLRRAFAEAGPVRTVARLASSGGTRPT